MKYALVLMAVLALAAFASTEFGAHAGLFIPTGRWSNTDVGNEDSVDYGASPMIGANVLIHMPMYAIEGSISYVFLSSNQDYPDMSTSMIPVMAGIRTYSGTIFYGGGLAYHIHRFSWSEDGQEEGIEGSEEFVGAYGNIGTILPMGGNDIELSGKLHWIDFDEFCLTATAGINF